MDAAFFPNSPESTNSPDNFIGEPKVIPRFGVATIAAQEKFNYFQTIGNHSEMTFHGRLFSSSMDGKEIHGEINGFSNISLDDDVIASMPLTTDSAAHDNWAHIRLSDAAIPRVLGKIKYALDSLP